MQVVVGSLLTQYSVVGTGKTILLLHGWGDTSRGLQSLQAVVGAAGYKAIAVDLPGFGGTEQPAEVWGLDDYVLFVRHFLDKIHEPAPWAIIGHSNGAALAIRGLAEGVLAAERLVLLGAAGIRNTNPGRLQVLKYAAKAGKALAMPLPKPVKQRLRKKAYTAIGSDMLVAEHLEETFKRVVSHDVREDAARLSMPVLLIYGENDDATPVWFGEQYRQLIPHATLEILPGAGHFVHLDRPEQVKTALMEHLA